MDRVTLTANLRRPVSRIELMRDYCRGKAVLDIGCVQHDIANVASEQWLHRAIAEVATQITGVDYLEDEVAQLASKGYQVICADVTKPIELDTRFDVVVVGNLIEHLSNFEGLMLNIGRLLKPNGCALISTANPFYREQYFYSAFKNDIIVNAEHTCWLDPVTLDQLARRFGFATSQVHWVKEKWGLADAIMDGRSYSLDLFNGCWMFRETPSFLERLVSPVLYVAFETIFPKSYVERALIKYGRDLRRLLYVKFLGALFGVFWALYRPLVVTSPINRHELFVSVLTREN